MLTSRRELLTAASHIVNWTNRSTSKPAILYTTVPILFENHDLDVTRASHSRVLHNLYYCLWTFE